MLELELSATLHTNCLHPFRPNAPLVSLHETTTTFTNRENAFEQTSVAFRLSHLRNGSFVAKVLKMLRIV